MIFFLKSSPLTMDIIMSDDLKQIKIKFSVDTSDVNKRLAKIENSTNRTMKTLVTEARNASAQASKIFDDLSRRSAMSIASIGKALNVQDLIGLSDTWTTLTNKVSAVSQSTNIQARSMSDLVKGADDARSSIEAYTDLYTKLMLSASGVAKNEEEIALATNILSKAFVAGGASASEQAAGIAQLGQALSSGILSGDELNSLREKAPLLAEAIAKEFGTTVDRLKDLGEEGKVTIDRVFKAILSSRQDIEKQFDATDVTMSDGLTRVKNALTEYVGVGGQATGISHSITQGLIMIADNFDKVASIGAVVSGVIAGQLVGRALPNLITRFSEAGISAKEFYKTLREAKTLGNVLNAISGSGALLGVAGAVVGGAVTYAMSVYTQKAAEAAERTRVLKDELRSMGLISDEASKKVEELSATTGKLGSTTKGNFGPAENLRRVQMIREENNRMRYGSFFGREDEIPNLRALVHNSVNGGDDAKAAKIIDEFLNSLGKVPAMAELSSEKMEALRNSLDLTEPLIKATYKIEEVTQTMKGNMINARIKGEDIISPETRQYVQECWKEIWFTTGDRDGGPTLTATRQLWQEYENGTITLQEVEQKLRELDTLSERSIKKIISHFENLNIALNATNQMLSEALAQSIKFNANQAVNYIKDSPIGHWVGILMDSAKNNPTFAIDNKDNPDQPKTQVKRSDLAHSAEPNKKKKEQTNDYENLVNSTKERIEAIKNETAATAQLNPLVKDYGYSLEKAKKQLELQTAAKKSDIELTPQITQSIEEQASNYAKAAFEQAKLTAQQEEIRQRYQTLKDTSRDATRTFIDGMISGETAAKSFSDSLSLIGKKLVDVSLNSIFDKLFDVTDSKSQSGGGIFGGIGQIFGFAAGGYTGSGGTYDAAGIVHRGEYVFSKQAVQNVGVGNLDTLHSYLKAPTGTSSNLTAFMPSTPSISDLKALQIQKTEKERAMSIRVTPSKYFDVHVEEISGKVTSTGIQQYDKVLDNTLGVKLNNGRQMNRY